MLRVITKGTTVRVRKGKQPKHIIKGKRFKETSIKLRGKKADNY